MKTHFCVLSVFLQISELQKELSELEKCNEELEDEVEMKKAAYVEEIADLEVWMWTDYCNHGQ